jgi:hypothetical protein
MFNSVGNDLLEANTSLNFYWQRIVFFAKWYEIIITVIE